MKAGKFKMINVTIWNEYLHELESQQIADIYPEGIHKAIAKGIQDEDFFIRTATLNEPEHGLTDEVLNATDVLIWWGHKAHHLVEDAIVEKIYERVQNGMGLIVLHSGHASKIFRKLCGTHSEMLKWRDVGERELLWVLDPSHPIVRGLGECIDLPHEETYGEFFNVPNPDSLVLVSWFEGGEVFRSGFTLTRGYGKIFYFRPGHESHPTYYNSDVLKILKNAVRWAKPNWVPQISYDMVKSRVHTH